MLSEKLPVELSKGFNGLEKIILREARGSSAEVYLYGGHVTSWKNEHAEELLFFSTKAMNSCVKHSLYSIFSPFIGHTRHCLSLQKQFEEEFQYASLNYEFRLRVALGLGGDLMLTSRIRNMNTNGKPFTFAFAYHTYFSVSDISEVRVEGLGTLDYLDNLQNKERFTEQGDAITFETEVDRIYLSAPTKIAILDHEKKRTFAIRKDGLPAAVVWNPWDKKAKALADFGDDEYKLMLCVETAATEKPITLKPGGEWRGSQELCAVPSSYCGGLLDARKVLQCAEKMHY
ncbi:hypothetical protein J1N35_032882 [Gossypium stocksii]|uniref:glucose-6-phosphate 1-epimerase n=1 Tax=Gossypium stocksii TaxID=47602 RepID=A0A9D3V4E3_9ROSI|nr:hypothetical protein J1N35_032882 [Gossypium stocksii]